MEHAIFMLVMLHVYFLILLFLEQMSERTMY
jgi:hypothetical protein